MSTCCEVPRCGNVMVSKGYSCDNLVLAEWHSNDDWSNSDWDMNRSQNLKLSVVKLHVTQRHKHVVILAVWGK